MRLVTLLLGAALLACATAPPGQERSRDAGQGAADAPARAAVDAATAAAGRWLELVDGGRYAESWQAASPLFQQAVDAAAWEQAVVRVRAPLEPFGARHLESATYTTSVPGAPPRDYVVLIYATAAAGGLRVRETVTPRREADGEWRVAGYFVRPP